MQDNHSNAKNNASILENTITDEGIFMEENTITDERTLEDALDLSKNGNDFVLFADTIVESMREGRIEDVKSAVDGALKDWRTRIKDSNYVFEPANGAVSHDILHVMELYKVLYTHLFYKECPIPLW